jgi:UrcA family protein
MTNRFSIRSRLTAIVLATASVAILAGAAQAEDQRIAVGDLSQPGQAQAFMHRLDVTARSMCDFYADSASRPAQVAACKDAVRAEALDQLPQTQRAQLIAHANDGMRMAVQNRRI